MRGPVPLQIVVDGFAFGQALSPPVVVDHDVDMVGVVQ